MSNDDVKRIIQSKIPPSNDTEFGGYDMFGAPPVLSDSSTMLGVIQLIFEDMHNERVPDGGVPLLQHVAKRVSEFFQSYRFHRTRTCLDVAAALEAATGGARGYLEAKDDALVRPDLLDEVHGDMSGWVKTHQSLLAPQLFYPHSGDDDPLVNAKVCTYEYRLAYTDDTLGHEAASGYEVACASYGGAGARVRLLKRGEHAVYLVLGPYLARTYLVLTKKGAAPKEPILAAAMMCSDGTYKIGQAHPEANERLVHDYARKGANPTDATAYRLFDDALAGAARARAERDAVAAFDPNDVFHGEGMPAIGVEKTLLGQANALTRKRGEETRGHLFPKRARAA